jgi:hypothetical protein
MTTCSILRTTRDVVKMWVTASFGNNAPITKWPKELAAKCREKTGKTLGKRYPASKVGESVIRSLPSFRQNQTTIRSGYTTLSNDPEVYNDEALKL